jgi:hypothetical protein
VTDLTGNGRPDVIVVGMGASPTVSVGGKTISLRELPGLDRAFDAIETNAFWYENPGWERHTLAAESGLHLGVGATLHDVDGDGRVDLLVGQGYQHSDLYWYRHPADPRDPWTQFVVDDRFQKYHDLTVADVDSDGEDELVGLSQEAATIFYYDLPDDPTLEPWPADNCTIVDDDVAVEGVHVGDVDGDGRNELVAGTAIYHNDGSTWRRERIADGWDDVRVAVGDLTGDGRQEIVLSEGDSPTHGTHPGRVGVATAPEWDVTILADGLFCPHSLQLADITGDGRLDVFVGEMGLGENERPKHYLFRNEGDGVFERHVVATGVPTHEAKVADLTGNGRVDVVGKSYGPAHHVDAWFNTGADAAAASTTDQGRSVSSETRKRAPGRPS